jgi:hypothetical protein
MPELMKECLGLSWVGGRPGDRSVTSKHKLMLEYDVASDKFRLGNLTDKPPQGNDARCGFACHTAVKSKDYVFTD